MSKTIEIDDQLNAQIQGLLATGHYESMLDVISAGVGLVQDKERNLIDVNAAIERSLADVAAGRVKPADEVFERLKAKYNAMLG